jgi:hypothetical protein
MLQTMNEPRRLTYLQALGIDSYVSRVQLPGAAPTRRLAMVRPARAAEVRAENTVDGVPEQRQLRADIALPARPAGRQDDAQTTPLAALSPRTRTPTVRANLVAVFAGGVAWLESLQGRPLATEQLKLVQAMARAVHGEAATPKVAQFDWPMHSNHQLDQGIAAARAAAAAFLRRHIDEQKCRAVVLLGQGGAEFVDLAQLGDIACVTTLSTVEMLEAPAAKRRVWSDLQAIVLRA